MVKAYLRYTEEFSFGVITSGCNGIFDRSGTRFITAVLEGVAIWKARNGKRIALLKEPISDTQRPAEVKCISKSPTEDVIAVGYSDGAVKLWDLNSQRLTATFHGHKRAVMSFCFSQSGKLLASGSQDTSICVWDLVSETGLFKLNGHTNEITGICFLSDDKYLVSGSKDGQLKLWELKTQHCWQTLLHERGVIWSISIHPSHQCLIVGSIGPHLEVYDLVEELESCTLKLKTTLIRREEDKVQSLVHSVDGQYLACKNSSNIVEIFKFQSTKEAQEDQERRRKASEKILKELRKKAKKSPLTKKELKKKTKHESRLQQSNPASVLEPYRLTQRFEGPSKMLSIDFRLPKKKKSTVEIGIALSNNAFEIRPLFQEEEEEDSGEKTIRVYHDGHRSGIRSLSLSSNDGLLLSLSEKEIKIWNSENGRCVHSLASGFGLTGLFAPGDSLVVVGTKTGKLEIFDLHSSMLVESIEGHGGPIWSTVALPDQSGFLSGGADRHVKFWNWGLKASETKKQASIKLQKDRGLELESDVLSMKISPNGKFLAVALLDATIRLFYLDSMTVYLTLYGHKLPVLSVDISADNQLLISGSADKNVKIWGMDFGDCHKSLFAHNDSITQVAFVHTTHYFFSVGKDRMLKYWDADKFQLLLELPGHHAEVWCLAISQEGDFLITGSNDRSLRKWTRLEESFFLEEEKEKRREQIFDQDLLDADSRPGRSKEDKTESVGIAGQKTVSSINAADSIIEALELTSLELKKDPKESANPLLLGLEPDAFVLRAIQNIKSTDLEMALLSISFSDALLLLKYLAHWLKRSSGQTEMICKITVMLVRLHLPQLASSLNAREVLLEIQSTLRPLITRMKDNVGFNLEGIKFIRSLLSKEQNNDFNQL